jgi:acetolactate decarboxylase
VTRHLVALFLGAAIFTSCSTRVEPIAQTYSDVKIAGAMRNVMWKSELEGVIQIDTIREKKGLYALGPLSFLRGEIMINDGEAYVSRVTSDTTMWVEKTFDVSAPFLVYATINEWTELDLPDSIKTIKELEFFVDLKTQSAKRPFALKLTGKIASAKIHVQNLAPGAKVSSPQEAHSGQVKFALENEEVAIVGFFSTEHQGVFTHHDTYLHLHLITSDEAEMGHLDAVEFGKMKLYLPKS